jgi:thiamine transport system permease protein
MRADFISGFDFQNFFWSLKNSLIQGFGTVVICTLLGTYLSFGYLYFSSRAQGFLKLLCQLSFVLPSIFSILICLNLINPFPYGHLGVIFVFTIVHLGFSVVYISSSIVSKIKNLGLVSKTYNIKKRDFYMRIMLPLMYKDLVILGLIIFLSCISSLSVPLIVGGGQGTNLEVYIFEKIFIDQKWTEAIVLSLVQGFSLYIMTKYILNRSHSIIKQTSVFSSEYLCSKLAAAGLVVYLSVYILSYLIKTVDVILNTDLRNLFQEDFFIALQNSIFIFLSLSLMFLAFTFYMLLNLFNLKKVSILNLFLNPSTVLIGFGLYLLLPGNGYGFEMFRVNLGIALLFFAGVYKIYLAPVVDELGYQVINCRIYNVGVIEFVFCIAWPQIRQQVIFSISILYLLSVSEFALLKATGAQVVTLGTLTESYLNSYRMQQAYALSFFALLSWAVVYYIMRFVYVRDRKFRF